MRGAKRSRAIAAGCMGEEPLFGTSEAEPPHPDAEGKEEINERI